MSRRTVYLDIDGVLATSRTYKKCPGNSQELLDPEMVERLCQFCEAIDADIVLISYWRKLYDLAWFQKHVGTRVVRMTKLTELMRWEEVQMDVEAHGVTDFVIFEDENDMVPYRGHWVRTNFEGPNQGLTRRHIRRALNILGYKNADQLSREIG